MKQVFLVSLLFRKWGRWGTYIEEGACLILRPKEWVLILRRRGHLLEHRCLFKEIWCLTYFSCFKISKRNLLRVQEKIWKDRITRMLQVLAPQVNPSLLGYVKLCTMLSISKKILVLWHSIEELSVLGDKDKLFGLPNEAEPKIKSQERRLQMADRDDSWMTWDTMRPCIVQTSLKITINPLTPSSSLSFSLLSTIQFLQC